MAELSSIEQQDILARKPRSLWRDSLQRLLRNRLALAGGAVVIFVALVAILAAFIAPFGFAEQDLVLNNAVPPLADVAHARRGGKLRPNHAQVPLGRRLAGA